MSIPPRTSSRAVLLAAIVILSVASVPLAASGAPPNPSPLPDAQVFEASSEVSVWERAIYPLRSDNTNAPTRIEPPDARAEGTGIGEKKLVFTRGGQRNPVGVFTAGDTISLDFDRARASGPSSLDSENVQILAARLKDSGDGVPTTFSEFLALTEPAKANNNATFQMIDANRQLSGGATSFSYTASTAGYYVFFVAMNESGENGYSAPTGSLGSLSQFGNVTILGTTGVTVQEAPSTVTAPSSATRGNSISFDVDASSSFSSSDDVTHIVALYKKDTFTGSIQRIKIDPAQLDANFNISEDSTLESSIGETKGVADVDPGVTVNGETLSNGHISRSVGIETGVDFLAEELGSNPPSITRISPESTLYGSVRAVSGESRDTTVTVETRSDFDTGTYQWVHLAKLDNGDIVKATDAGTLSIRAASTGGGGGGGGGDDDDAGQTSDDGTSVESTGSARATVTKTATTTTVTIQNAQQGDTVRVSNSEDEINTELAARGTALEEVETTFEDQTDFEMSISSSSDKPDPSIPDPPSDRGTVGYINVQHSANDDAIGEVRFNFRVTQARLDERGISPDEVVLYRYSGGEWTALETEPAGTAPDGSLRFRAVSPGLSVFAIGSRPAQQATTTAEPTTTEAPPETTTAPPETAAPTTAPPAPVQEPGAFGGVTLVLVIAVLVILVGGGLWYYRERRE